jgi:Coenzyme PQQ synthesis protein D (PqqD)
MSLVYRRCSTIEMAPLQDETILFDPQKNQFCLLNRTAAFLWNQLATPASPHALGMKLCENVSGVTLESAVRDANSALQEMRSLDMVVEESQPVSEQENKATAAPQTIAGQANQLPVYEPPRLTVMDDKQVMSVFQVPVVAGSWWG